MERTMNFFSILTLLIFHQRLIGCTLTSNSSVPLGTAAVDVSTPAGTSTVSERVPKAIQANGNGDTVYVSIPPETFKSPMAFRYMYTVGQQKSKALTEFRSPRMLYSYGYESEAQGKASVQKPVRQQMSVVVLPTGTGPKSSVNTVRSTVISQKTPTSPAKVTSSDGTTKEAAVQVTTGTTDAAKGTQAGAGDDNGKTVGTTTQSDAAAYGGYPNKPPGIQLQNHITQTYDDYYEADDGHGHGEDGSSEGHEEDVNPYYEFTLPGWGAHRGPSRPAISVSFTDNDNSYFWNVPHAQAPNRRHSLYNQISSRSSYVDPVLDRILWETSFWDK